MNYLEFIARVASHIPDKRQVTVRYYNIYGNGHRGKVRKAKPDKHPFILINEERMQIPRRSWAEMIRKVYEVEVVNLAAIKRQVLIQASAIG